MTRWTSRTRKGIHGSFAGRIDVRVLGILFAVTGLALGYYLLATLLLAACTLVPRRRLFTRRPPSRVPACSAATENPHHWIGDETDLLDPLGEYAASQRIEEAGRSDPFSEDYPNS
jgi:uncharacterized SAM-binding protein YcdF (DUF218 family)